MTILLCVHLWAQPGQRDAMSAYEDDVLAMLDDHDATLLHRWRSLEAGAGPDETQVVSLPDEAALAGFMADPRRAAMTARREATVARTEMQRVEEV